MWRILKNSLRRLRLLIYRRRIAHALALNRRGDARSDGLRPHAIRTRIEIEWRARDIHPWDRDSPPQEKAQLFVAQSLADTETVISELFEKLPQIDVIDLIVRHPVSDAPIMAGAVPRAAVTSEQRRSESIRMRLSELGVRYRLTDTHFEAITSDWSPG